MRRAGAVPTMPLLEIIKRPLRPLRRRFGGRLGDPVLREPDVTPAERATFAAVCDYTGTSVMRLISLIRACEHVERNGLSGSMVECGVWRGGSMMAVARTLLANGTTDLDLYLFDTFQGMSPPTEFDVDLDGAVAAEVLAETPRGSGAWCRSEIALPTRTMLLVQSGNPVREA